MGTETIPGTKAIAQRIINAYENFIALCTEQGFTIEEAAKILEVYKKAKAVKLNSAMGRYDFTHGAFVNTEVMRRALDA